MPASVPSPYQALYRFNYSPLPSCLALWPASLTTEQACFYKAAVKRGESRYRRSWGLFRRSNILHRSVYSALWLGGLRCQCRRQTNGPLTARCPCMMVLGKKKHSVGPFSASAHRENARYARLPVQPWLRAFCSTDWYSSLFRNQALEPYMVLSVSGSTEEKINQTIF